MTCSFDCLGHIWGAEIISNANTSLCLIKKLLNNTKSIFHCCPYSFYMIWKIIGVGYGYNVRCSSYIFAQYSQPFTKLLRKYYPSTMILFVQFSILLYVLCFLPHVVLTLNVRGPSYLGLTRSISWLLMPWLLTSPGHQQPWYWLCGIGRFLSYLRNDFNYLRRINVDKWHKI